MSDTRIIAMAIFAAVGAFSPISLPYLPMALVSCALLLWGKQRLFIALLTLTISAHSAQEWRSLHRALPPTVNGVATLVNDPDASGHATRVEVTLNDRHYELWATTSDAATLQSMHAGDQVLVHGTTRALNGKRAPSLRRRHVAGTITATTLVAQGSTSEYNVVPNGLRQLLERGSASMSSDNQSLFTGLVYGDDRNQSEQSVAQFRASGLAHLTAVSGANVAFVLALSVPLLRSLGLTGRFFGGAAILLVFGAVTRWEPSVVRAEAMAAVVLYASFVGRPISLIRCLCIASTITLAIDPFLVGSIGYLLSVVACIGMAILGETFSARSPGGERFQRVIGYSAAAQLAVAPVQVVVFGNVPLVGLVTNALADPAAAVVMMWGLPAGLLAGIIGGSAATLLHLPTVVFLEYLRLVARHGAAANADPLVRWMVLLIPLIGLWSWKRRSRVD